MVSYTCAVPALSNHSAIHADMPSKALEKHRPSIALLSECKPAVIKRFLQKTDPALVRAVSECCKNILSGNVNLSENEYKTLKRYHPQLKGLALKSTSNKKKKELIQCGGFLQALIAPLIGLLGSVISGVIARKHKKK